MKKIVILGCENTHANSFLEFITKEEKYKDVQVLGVYSDDEAAAQKLHDTYGVPVMSAYDEAVGQVDGVIITARHGDNHYKYAKPYLPSGVPMFIDKPITVSESDALALAKALKEYNVPFTGGSSCRFDKTVLNLKEEMKNEVGGKTVGGFVKAPISMNNAYGGFFFYSQHLAEIVMEIFGRYPKSVKTYEKDGKYTVVFRYDEYDVTGLYVEDSYCYFASRVAMEQTSGAALEMGMDIFRAEFDVFYSLLCGGKEEMDLKAFVAPVYVLNAIKRSMDTGEETLVEQAEI